MWLYWLKNNSNKPIEVLRSHLQHTEEKKYQIGSISLLKFRHAIEVQDIRKTIVVDPHHCNAAPGWFLMQLRRWAAEQGPLVSIT
jgi:hypothetical protein